MIVDDTALSKKGAYSVGVAPQYASCRSVDHQTSKAQSLRTLARATDGITAKVFCVLNELEVEAVRAGNEQITDEDVERWKPGLEREAVFA